MSCKNGPQAILVVCPIPSFRAAQLHNSVHIHRSMSDSVTYILYCCRVSCLFETWLPGVKVLDPLLFQIRMTTFIVDEFNIFSNLLLTFS